MDGMLDTFSLPLLSDAGATDDNNVADPTANEVTQAKHKDDEATSSVTKQVASNSDNDKKKNNGGIAEARENYKFDVSISTLVSRIICHVF
jgi:hypothetical protein